MALTSKAKLLVENDGVVMKMELSELYKKSLERFVKFSAVVYVPDFLKSSVGADAPINDLEFIKLLLKYTSIDAECALNAMKSRHLYYLPEENLVFSLFSNRIDDDLKSRIA